VAKIPVTIRPLAAQDRKAWAPLWAGYLKFYKETLPTDVTEQTFKRLVGGMEPMFGLVAEVDGRIVGFTHCVVHRSTWAREIYVYLEDLFVAPDVRGSGAGRALIEAVYRRADAMGADRVYWHTQEGNATARELYDRIAKSDDFVRYKRR
jgi:GNAT superfamily N-acetyltransferase